MVSLFPALFVFFIDINSQFDNLKSSLAMGGSLWIISMGQIESERWVTLNWTSGSFSIGTVGQLRRIKQFFQSPFLFLTGMLHKLKFIALIATHSYTNANLIAREAMASNRFKIDYFIKKGSRVFYPLLFPKIYAYASNLHKS